MNRHFALLLFIVLLSGLACSLPGLERVPMPVSEDETPPEVVSVSVSPPSGSGEFTGTIVFTHGAVPGTLSCKWGNQMDRLLGYKFLDVPADSSLKQGSLSIVFQVSEPGEWSLRCTRVNYLLGGEAPFTVTQPPTATQLAMVWQEIGTGDCTGQDVNFTDGATPDPNLAAAGLIAVCWDGQTYINGGEPGKVFCTYKSVTADQCVGGANIGVMYQAIPK